MAEASPASTPRAAEVAAAAAAENSSTSEPLSARQLAAAGRVLAARAALEGEAGESEEDRQFAERVRQQASAVEDALAELSGDNAGWTVALDGELFGDLRASYKHEDGSLVHSVLLSGVVDAPTGHVLAIAREFDLVASWNNFLLDTTILETTSLLSVVVYAGLWVPPPLSNRDFAVHVQGFDLLDEHGCVLVLFNSADVDPASLPPGAASRVRMNWKSAAIALRPVPGGGTVGTLVAHVDPAMPGNIQPPSWAVSWAMKVLCPYIYRAACRVAVSVVSPGSVHAERIGANPALYEMVAERERAYRATLPFLLEGEEKRIMEAEAPAEEPRRGGLLGMLGGAW